MSAEEEGQEFINSKKGKSITKRDSKSNIPFFYSKEDYWEGKLKYCKLVTN